MTTCTRRCLDLRRTGDRARMAYVGAWLPEPIQTPIEPDAEEKAILSSSLTKAFLMMLERLTPKERAAFLLHEIFDQPYADVAAALDLSEANCRKLVSRARTHVKKHKTRADTPLDHQTRILNAFQSAVTQGEVGELSALLAQDVRLSADGGGKVAAILETLTGREEVMQFATNQLHQYWSGQNWRVVPINGALGLLISDASGTTAVVSFAHDTDGLLTDVFIVRNPDKLSHQDTVTIH